jgi:long-subunit fatty acid transport protein
MKKLDLQGSASYIDTEYTGGIPSRGDDGYLVSVGARSMLTRKLELNAFASYDSRRNIINTDNHNMIYSVGGAYKLTREFSMVASISHGDLADQYGIGVRLGF